MQETLKLTVLNSSGDEVMVADPTDTEALALVQERFRDLMSQGYSAFLEGLPGEGAERIDSLPDSGAVLLFAQLQGG